MATVDDLLRTLHHQAAGLRPTGDPARQLDAHLRGWMPLAANARRVLDALDPYPEDRELYRQLRILEHGRATRPGPSDAALERLALTMGALGDVILSAPEQVGKAGQNERSRLHASIQAALHATARATLDIARTEGQPATVETVRTVAEATELAALMPPVARVSSLERLTVTRLTADTADGAVQLWAKAARATLGNYQIVTGIALQDAAATLALLSHTAAGTLREAARRRLLDPDPARHTAHQLDDASAAWRRAAIWPPNVQLGGRAHEHQRAARAVRDALTGPPLNRLTLRERVHTLRAVIATAAGIGELQAAIVDLLVKHGGLWIAHERPNLRPPGVQRRHVKLDWETMPWPHPYGSVLIGRSSAARKALDKAAASLDQTVLPAAGLTGEAGQIALVDHRIVADWWESIEPAARTRRPEDERAARPGIERRPGIPR